MRTGGKSKSRSAFPMPRWMIFTALGGTLAIGGLLLTPSIIVANAGGYRNREIKKSSSPSSQFQIQVLMRAEFPAWDIVSPNSVLRIRLFKAGEPSPVTEIKVSLVEDGDLGTISFEWGPTHVVIRDFDQRNPSRAVTVGLTTT